MFALNNIENDFQNTVFVDESSVWTFRQGLYHHRRKSSLPRANAIHPPHPSKLHIWGGITWDGPIPFVYFDSNLTSEAYEIIIDGHLGPFMRNFNHGNCRLLQDNAPTHVTDNIFNSLHRNRIRWVSKNFFVFKIILA